MRAREEERRLTTEQNLSFHPFSDSLSHSLVSSLSHLSWTKAERAQRGVLSEVELDLTRVENTVCSIPSTPSLVGRERRRVLRQPMLDCSPSSSVEGSDSRVARWIWQAERKAEPRDGGRRRLTLQAEPWTSAR